MKTNSLILIVLPLLLTVFSCEKNTEEEHEAEKKYYFPSDSTDNSGYTNYKERHRPQFHFTPIEKWMNDPNGLVYHNGWYHLFYQYYPEDIVWGPMHWGHAVSKDLIKWEHKPIALYPDEYGYIFSGSALVDEHNTSGLGTKDNPPLIAVFTYHDPKGEKEKRADFQYQGLAYSLDGGDTWTKYPKPIIENTDKVRDFRDPKVFWHAPSQQWIMLLVAGDHVKIYNSSNLLDWQWVSEFGREVGAHGGVWECPDLFELAVEGTDEKKWVLIVSINPGAPNGGSGTQYFIGDFDGKNFISPQKEARWLDYGTDNYAGITYNNTPNEDRIFIGWMSNWSYAQRVPTTVWRSAMTLPRKLSLKKVGGALVLANLPPADIHTYASKIEDRKNISIHSSQPFIFDHSDIKQSLTEFSLQTVNKEVLELIFSNDKNEHITVELNLSENKLRFDRTQSGHVSFSDDFFGIIELPFVLEDDKVNVQIFMDWSSVEIFLNETYALTALLFPNEPYSRMKISSDSAVTLEHINVSKIRSIW